MTSRRARRTAGFSLLEVLMAVALVGIGLPAVCQLFFFATRQDSDIDSVVQAEYLGNMLINEISRRRFRESVAKPAGLPESDQVNGYSRLLFNDVSDYSIFKDQWGALSPPLDESGNVITGFEKYSQFVTVYNVLPPTSSGGTRSFAPQSDGSTDFKLVTVTISWLNGTRSVNVSKLFALSP